MQPNLNFSRLGENYLFSGGARAHPRILRGTPACA